jgi:hypothetical protein
VRYAQHPIIAEIARQSTALLDGLSESQRSVAHYPFTATDIRHRWTYRPRPRTGLTFAELDRRQRKTVHNMLATVLSPHAYAQAATIMALEDVLDHAEHHRRDRHQTDYWIVLFGEPKADQPWGWRFEGHHLSVNITVHDDQLFTTPCFFGANPAVVRYGDTPVVAPLSQEEHLARTFLYALDPGNRRLAVVSDVAPDDIRTRTAARIDAAIEPRGVPLGRVHAPAEQPLRDLVALYVHRFRNDLAVQQSLDLNHDEIYFAWEGHPEPGHAHYYRIHAGNLLIEYDNTANRANHIHSVIRRPADDFGGDPLANHHTRHHNSQKPSD